MRDYFFNKHVEYCESVRSKQVVNNLKGKYFFPDQINRNNLDLIVRRLDRNCSTM